MNNLVVEIIGLSFVKFRSQMASIGIEHLLQVFVHESIIMVGVCLQALANDDLIIHGLPFEIVISGRPLLATLTGVVEWVGDVGRSEVVGNGVRVRVVERRGKATASV